MSHGPYPYPCVVVANWTCDTHVDAWTVDKRGRRAREVAFTSACAALAHARRLGKRLSLPVYRGIVYADGRRAPRWRKCATIPSERIEVARVVPSNS